MANFAFSFGVKGNATYSKLAQKVELSGIETQLDIQGETSPDDIRAWNEGGAILLQGIKDVIDMAPALCSHISDLRLHAEERRQALDERHMTFIDERTEKLRKAQDEREARLATQRQERWERSERFRSQLRNDIATSGQKEGE